MKKWTYLVAAGMLLGAAPVFTGCIDNDEPEGITILRGAKAELLKAKAAVEAAKVAQVQAEAAYRDAETQLKLAEVELKKQEAAYKEAQALEMQYKAELANIQNEAERAELENQIAIYAEQRAAAARAAQEAAARLEVNLMTLKVSLAKQQALYEQAMKDLALAKNTLTDAQITYLDPFTTDVENAQEEVDRIAEQYESAAKELVALQAEFDKEKAKESWLRSEKKAIADAEKELEAVKVARDRAKEYTEKDIEAANLWEEEKTKLEETLKTLETTLADLEVARTKIEIETRDEAQQVNKLKVTYQDLTGYTWNEKLKDFNDIIGDSKDDLKLNPVEILINEASIAFMNNPVIWDETVEATYKYSDYLKALNNNVEFKPDNVLRFESIKKDIESRALTANKQAWTENDIAQYERNLERQNEFTDGLKAEWETAVKAYKGLETGDASVFEGFDKVEEAVAIYNDLAKEMNTARTAYITFKTEKLDPVTTDYDEALTLINENYQKAIIANEEKYNNTIADINEQLGTLENAAKVAQAEYEKVLQQFEMGNATENQKTAAQTAAKEAWDAYRKAWDAANGYYDSSSNKYVTGSKKKASDLRDQENILAEKERNLAEAKEYEAYFKLNPNNALEKEYNKLKQSYQEAFYEVSNYVYDDIDDNLKGILKTFYLDNSLSIKESGLRDLVKYDEETQTYYATETTGKNVAVIDIYELRYKIQEMSRRLYGYNHQDRLIPLTTEEIDAEIKENYNNDNVPYYVYLNRLTGYGATGWVLYYTEYIKQGKAYISDNGATIKKYSELLQSYIDDVYAQIETYTNDVVSPAGTAFIEAFTTLDAKFIEIDDKIDAANNEKHATKPVLDKINAAISAYILQEELPNGEEHSITTIEELRKRLQEIYETEENNVYEKETTLIEKKENMQSVIDGYQDPIDSKKAQVEELANDLTEAQAELKAATEALEAEIVRISATE